MKSINLKQTSEDQLIFMTIVAAAIAKPQERPLGFPCKVEYFKSKDFPPWLSPVLSLAKQSTAAVQGGSVWKKMIMDGKKYLPQRIPHL